MSSTRALHLSLPSLCRHLPTLLPKAPCQATARATLPRNKESMSPNSPIARTILLIDGCRTQTTSLGLHCSLATPMRSAYLLLLRSLLTRARHRPRRHLHDRILEASLDLYVGSRSTSNQTIFIWRWLT